MNNDKKEFAEHDVARLLALKSYELPDGNRSEKNIQNIMRQVRSVSNSPALLILPDKGMGWMFAQPRYGIAALFILFLGLHLVERPMPKAPIGGTVVLEPPVSAAAAAIATVDTNVIQKMAFPGIVKDPLYNTPYAPRPQAVLTSFSE